MQNTAQNFAYTSLIYFHVYQGGYGRTCHSRRGRPDKRRDGNKPKPVVGDRGKAILESIDDDSLVIQSFRRYGAELDAKHDKHERIVKHSRDITIESKRIIFLLHTLDRESKEATVLKDAEARISKLTTTHFKAIAQELDGEDPYQYSKAYTSGMQEFIEAVTFYHYLKSNVLESWINIQKDFVYNVGESTNEQDGAEIKAFDENKQEKECTPEESAIETSSQKSHITTLLIPTDYFLGVGDLTGELMRKCINNLGSGNIEGCYQTSAFVREIYKGFLSIGNVAKEMSRKVYTLRQSLSKMENACYTIHVRGSEIPKHMLADVLSSSHDDMMDEDEGFY
uniref:Translin-associated protein X n=2 Tax=Timema TaxID=61471 RepID=A0A7R9K1D9_TIMGE|nr:unnamed protein product [Timema genevievae]